MSKFNTSTEGTMKTVNKEGFGAYKMLPEDKLINQVLTSFFNEAKFYGDNSEELTNTLEQVVKTNPEFVSKLAIFARREFNMRSVSHVLAGYLANIPEGKPFVKKTVKSIVLRGDDATEILAFYLSEFGKPIPNSLRKALREVFSTFDAYTLAKYKGEGNSVKMRDIICLCHPEPKDDQQSKLWKDLLEGTIKPAYTWETELSAKGNTKETWTGLIESGRVGYMALLRNLRSILNNRPENIQKVFDKISDPAAVRQSKQLPFRFLSAYRNLPGGNWEHRYAGEALEKAADASIENLPKIPGKTVIAIDVSGSMSSRVSNKSDVSCSDIAILLGAIADRICERSIVYTFDDSLEELNLSKRDGILSTVTRYHSRGGGTDMYLPIEEMLNRHIDADRIIYLSDNECNHTFSRNGDSWGSMWYRAKHSFDTVQAAVDEYHRKINPNLWVHAIDLAGYGTQQFTGPRTNVIAGWSEKVFDFIMLAEQGEGALKQAIMNYTI